MTVIVEFITCKLPITQPFSTEYQNNLLFLTLIKIIHLELWRTD